MWSGRRPRPRRRGLCRGASRPGRAAHPAPPDWPARPHALHRPVIAAPASRRSCRGRRVRGDRAGWGHRLRARPKPAFAALAAALAAGGRCWSCPRSPSAPSGSALPPALRRPSRAMAFRHWTAERHDTWRGRRRQAQVVVGARSALFLPFPELGLIIVDEEHDPLLQAGGRGHLPGARHGGAACFAGRLPTILVSATPSLESLVNVRAAATSAWRCRAARATELPRCGSSICAERSSAAFLAPLWTPSSARPSGRRAGAPLQSARLRAILCRACGSAASSARAAPPGLSSIALPGAPLPPLRPRRDGAACCPEMPRGRSSRSCGPGSSAPARGGWPTAFRRPARR